jgi:outer membrane cobalamin receptor
MKIYLILVITLFINVLSLSAQSQTFTLSGSITDASDGEDLIGVNIAVKELPTTGVSTNTFGFYSLSLEEGEYTFFFSYLGYKTFTKKIHLNKDVKLNINLMLDATALTEVIVSAERSDENIVSNDIGVSKLSVRDIETVPVLFGEKDIMKTIQLLPGVKPAGDGNAGFYVRGGAADQNLILLDGAPVYNASHLMGFFSVFNSSAIKDVKLYKGTMPAEYGGRLASVMDVKMKEGNNKEYKVDGGIGIISSKLTFEGPIVKDEGSFMVSARRTYADLFLKLSNDEVQKDSKLYFYDLNLKANYRIGENDRIFISGYFGRDVLGYSDIFGFDWGNTTATLRWNHIFNNKLFSNTSFIFSDYNYKISISNDVALDISSRIQDWNFKQEFDYFLNESNTIKMGLNIIHHTFMPGELDSSTDDVDDFFIENKYSLESAAYISNNHKINSKLNLTYGLRFTNFTQLGPGTIITWDKNGNPVSVNEYDKGDVVASYNRLAPRFAATYVFNEEQSIKTSYVRSYQFLHMISNSNTSSPTDIWLPSSNNIAPSEADQVSLGYFRNFNENKWEFSSEIYYKSVKNIIDYKTGAQTTFNADVESELLYGDGRAYGIELLLKKRTGKLTGWVSYTLSKSENKFEEINNNTWFSAKQDRIHDFSIVASYHFNNRVVLSGTWVYFTGNAVTFPSGKYVIEGQVVPYYTERNGYRMPDYHRMDVGITFKNNNFKYEFNTETGEKEKVAKRFQSSWNFSIYNVYGRENAYSISFKESEDNPGTTEAVQLALFKFVPSVSYNFSF